MRPDIHTKAVLSVIALIGVIGFATSAHPQTPTSQQPASHQVAKSQNGATASNKAAPTSPVEAEARDVWLRVWNSRLRQCGGSYYRYDGQYLVGSKLVTEWGDHSVKETEPQEFVELIEAKGVSYAKLRVKTIPLTAADRFNNVEWRGTISGGPTFSAERVRARRMGVWQPWGEWRDASVDVHVELKKAAGQWAVSSGEVSFGPSKWTPVEDVARPQPACEALPTKD